jgi:hypothetical protein
LLRLCAEILLEQTRGQTQAALLVGQAELFDDLSTDYLSRTEEITFRCKGILIFVYMEQGFALPRHSPTLMNDDRDLAAGYSFGEREILNCSP